MKALLVGGTGPTGHFIVSGLLERGYDVTIFHRGTHEVPEIPPEVEHIHGDPHFPETIDEALAGRSFDLAMVSYGRLRFLAEALSGRVGRFLSAGGWVGIRGAMDPHALSPAGMTCPVTEEAPVVTSQDEHRIASKLTQAENTVFENHPDAAHFRFPAIYGPHQMGGGREWSIVRRILDKRPYIVLPDGGLSLCTHGYAANVAHAVLLAVDQPEAAAGQIYHCGDEEQLTLHQIVEVVAQAMNYEWEIVSMPASIAHPARAYTELTPHHQLMDLSKLKSQLGYKDVCPVKKALSKTVEWLLEHPIEPGAEVSHDPFDYAGEDRLVSAYKKSMEDLAAIPFDTESELTHPYAHPKEAEQASDERNR